VVQKSLGLADRINHASQVVPNMLRNVTVVGGKRTSHVL
jgi:hypothetical protein